MARRIPIGDATELDLEVPDTSKLDQGLRGPTEPPQPLGKAGPQFNRSSFQGPTMPEGIRAARAAAASEPVAAALGAERGVLKSAGILDTDVGALAGKGLRAGGGMVKSFVTGGGRAFIPVGLAAEAVDTAATPTEDFYARTGIEPGGLAKDIGVRALGTLQNIGNSVTFGLADRVGNLIAGNGFNRSTGPGYDAAPAASAAPAPAAPAAPTSTSPSVRQPFSDARFESQRQGGDPGTVTRDGNSFSGTNIREGFRYADGRPHTGTVSSLDTSAGAAADRAELARLRSTGAAGPDAYGPGANGGITGITTEDPAIANARRDRETQLGRLESVARNGLYSRERSNAADAYARLAGQPIPGAEGSASDTALRIAGLRERGETNRANALIAANTADRNLNREVTMRGQDFADAHSRALSRLAYAREAQDQNNKDRQFQLDVAKYGIEVAEKNRSAAAAAQKAQQDRLESTFRTTDRDGKDMPDHAKIASYNAAVDTTLPQMIRALEATGKPEAAAKARTLRERGAAALDPSDHAQLMQLFQTREQLRNTRSMLPGGAEFADSNDLLQFRQRPGAEGIDRRLLTPNRIQFVGGSSATPNDLSIRGGANAFLPDFGAVRTDDLLRGLRRE